MMALRHTNVLQIFGVCPSPPAIVSEYCARGSLTDVLRAARERPADLPWRRRLELVRGRRGRGVLEGAVGLGYASCLNPLCPPLPHHRPLALRGACSSCTPALPPSCTGERRPSSQSASLPATAAHHRFLPACNRSFPAQGPEEPQPAGGRPLGGEGAQQLLPCVPATAAAAGVNPWPSVSLSVAVVGVACLLQVSDFNLSRILGETARSQSSQAAMNPRWLVSAWDL
jgi:hypothetical protein